jgi:hypothetical protein
MGQQIFKDGKITNFSAENTNNATFEDLCKKLEFCHSAYAKYKSFYDDLDIPVIRPIAQLAELNKRLKDLYNKVCQDNLKAKSYNQMHATRK